MDKTTRYERLQMKRVSAFRDTGTCIPGSLAVSPVKPAPAASVMDCIYKSVKTPASSGLRIMTLARGWNNSLHLQVREGERLQVVVLSLAELTRLALGEKPGLTVSGGIRSLASLMVGQNSVTVRVWKRSPPARTAKQWQVKLTGAEWIAVKEQLTAWKPLLT